MLGQSTREAVAYLLLAIATVRAEVESDALAAIFLQLTGRQITGDPCPGIALGGDGNTISTRYPNATIVCNEDLFVTAMDLDRVLCTTGNCDLASLAAKLTDLERLSYLDLNGIGLTGQIPANFLFKQILYQFGLGKVGSVRVDLDANSLSGSIPSFFIRNLRQVARSELYLRNNNLSGVVPADAALLSEFQVSGNPLLVLLPPAPPAAPPPPPPSPPASFPPPHPPFGPPAGIISISDSGWQSDIAAVAAIVFFVILVLVIAFCCYRRCQNGGGGLATFGVEMGKV